jgi:DNA-binding response OmpR family regulator
MMPEMDGYAVAKSIRNNPNADHTHIIFLTAKGTKDDRMEGYNSGAEYYIVKPFDNDDILSKVKELV